MIACGANQREITLCVKRYQALVEPELDATMMRDPRKLRPMQASLSLLWASVGCLSMEPISSYSSGERALAEAPAALEPEFETPLPDGPLSVDTEGAAAAPPDEPSVMEGPPGDGQVALDPGVEEAPLPEPEPLPSCIGPGEFASDDGASCYLASSQDATWLDALESCESWGGSLVKIDSREEDDLLGERMTTTFWIAASDRVQEGQVFWSGGAPLLFTNWSQGQPDDFQGREDCVVKTAPAGTWNDRPCGNVNPFVCERSEE